MPTLTLKNLPADLHRKLKARAKSNHRSLNSEVIACLRDVILAEPPTAEELLAEARELRRTFRGFVTDEQLERFKDEGRS